MDDDLQRLARQAPTDPVGRGRWFRTQLRAGTLSPEDLSLLCALGEPGAPQATHTAHPPLELLPWVERLGEAGGDAWLARARVGAVRQVLVLWTARFPEEVSPEVSVLAGEAWLESGSEEDLEEARRWAQEAGRLATDLYGVDQLGSPWDYTRSAVVLTGLHLDARGQDARDMTVRVLYRCIEARTREALRRAGVVDLERQIATRRVLEALSLALRRVVWARLSA